MKHFNNYFIRELRKMNYLENIDGLYNPKELEDRIITVGELNNLLGNNIALLKIIDVVTSYNYSDKELREIKGTKDSKFKTFEADTDIYIKVLTTKETYFLKLREELDYYNPTPAIFDVWERLFQRNKKKKYLKHQKIKHINVVIRV